MLSKDKKVILLQPPNLCKTFTRSGSVYPPLGLCQLASVDNKNIIEVFDAEGLNLSEDETKRVLKSHKPLIIGLSVTSFTLDIIAEILCWRSNLSLSSPILATWAS